MNLFTRPARPALPQISVRTAGSRLRLGGQARLRPGSALICGPFLAIIVLATHKNEPSCAATVLVNAHSPPLVACEQSGPDSVLKDGNIAKAAGGAKRLRNYVCGLYYVSLPSAVVLFSGSSIFLDGLSPALLVLSKYNGRSPGSLYFRSPIVSARLSSAKPSKMPTWTPLLNTGIHPRS